MNLREHRKKSNKTLQQAAPEIGTDPSNLAKIERGQQTPSIDLARKIATYYDISLDDVFNHFESSEVA